MVRDLYTIFDIPPENGKGGTLAIDVNGHLFWNGKPVMVERGITLTTWQKVGAVIAVVSGGLVGVAALTQILDWFLTLICV